MATGFTQEEAFVRDNDDMGRPRLRYKIKCVGMELPQQYIPGWLYAGDLFEAVNELMDERDALKEKLKGGKGGKRKAEAASAGGVEVSGEW